MKSTKSLLETMEEQSERILNNDSLGLSLDERVNLVEELIKNKIDVILNKYEKE